MSTATVRPDTPPPAAPDRSPAARAPRRRSWRWLRLVAPFAVVVALLVVSAVAYTLQQPSTRDPRFLSPAATGGIGSSRLAGLLAAGGVPVERATSTSTALVSAARGDATLFIPAPDLVHRYYLRMLKLLPETTRVVLVTPDQSALDNARVPLVDAGRRWATATVAAGCHQSAALRAGPAAVLRQRFEPAEPDEFPPVERCYRDSLVTIGMIDAKPLVTVVGSADPFRNDRIGEHGNAVLATGLLDRSRRVVWLDIHAPDKAPGYRDDPALHDAPDAPPSLGPGSPDPDFPVPVSPGGEGGEPAPAASGSAGAQAGGGSSGSGGNPLDGAFPPWVWAGLAQVALAALLLALWRGRRLGAPVAEPLPVTVRASETVTGRGRLYQRAGARDRALDAVRSAALQRLRRTVPLPADADAPAVVEAVAARTGRDPDDVHDVLYGDAPERDRDLVAAIRAVGVLVDQVTGGPGGPAGSSEPAQSSEGETR